MEEVRASDDNQVFLALFNIPYSLDVHFVAAFSMASTRPLVYLNQAESIWHPL